MKDVDEYVQALKNAINNAIDEALEETATMIIGDTQAMTPVLTGALRRSWEHGDVETNGDVKTIEIGSDLEYAEPVENGHRQGSTFIKGRFMLKKAFEKNKDEMQDILNRKLEEME